MVNSKLLLACTIPLLIYGCAEPKKPKLYPNEHLGQVGDTSAQQDVEACIASAKAYGISETQDGQVGEKAAKGAALGAVSAATWELVRDGKIGQKTLAGTATGAATGATVGAFDSRKTDSVFMNFVNQCLADKGYRVIGWQ